MTDPTSPEATLVEMLANDHFADDQWDTRPELYCIVRRDGVEDVRLINFSDEFWAANHPRDVLWVIAKAMTIPAAPLPPIKFEDGDELAGMIFRCEGWGLVSDPNDAEASAAVHAAGVAHTIHERPDRIEVKAYTLVTEDGRFYYQFERGGDGPVWMTAGEGVIADLLEESFTGMRDKLAASRG